MSNTIQADYEQLESIAGNFGKEADNSTAMTARVRKSYEDLKNGGWLGRGAEAFFNEMDSEILPALERFFAALEKGQSVTQQIVGDVRQTDFKRVGGGLLVQSADFAPISAADLKLVTKRAPSEQELGDLLFAWRVAKYVKSNAIVFTSADRTLGIGAGQMSRVDSCRIAVWKANEAGLSLEGSIVASDAMFPFADGLVAAAEAGAKAAIQPGGSIRDEEVIAAADERNMAMVFTGHRHFRH